MFNIQEGKIKYIGIGQKLTFLRDNFLTILDTYGYVDLLAPPLSFQ
jgi:hypothetical protein